MDLKQALQRQEFCLYYHPIVDLENRIIIGVEALIRWEHPKRGILSPLNFIPFAEETGLILPIGEWVLRTACEQHNKWRDAGLPPMIMAVNVSGRQLQEPNFVECVQTILSETKLAPEHLEIEITESTVMDVHRVLPILHDLKQIGIRISLDDFGTGYSSLLYLSEFPIDTIKIDQSFVRKCTIDSKDATIVQATIAMARQLQLDVVAEGLESRDHLIFLQQNLCNKGQGYFLSKPLPPTELENRFNEIKKIIVLEGISQEVSREKWLEGELKKARQELRDTIRQQKGMIFKFVKKDGKFIHTMCDGELAYRIGLTPEHIVGRELTDFRDFDDAQMKLQYYTRAWAGEDNVTYEAESNGVWYLASLRPIRKGGEVVEVIASCVDITTRVTKEQEVSLLAKRLAEQESKYQLITENAHDLISIMDINGVIQYASPSHERILGEGASELEGKPVFLMAHFDDLPHMERRWIEMISTKSSVCIEWRFVKSDGSCIWIESIGTPVLSSKGEIDSIVVTGRDITNRKVHEERLRQREERYRLMVQNIWGLISVLDKNGVVTYVSSLHKTFLGFPLHHFEGRVSFELVHPDDRANVFKKFARMVSSNTPCHIVFRYQHAEGQWVHVEATGMPMPNDNGEMEKFVVVARDITERKQAEDIIRKSEQLSVAGKLVAGIAHQIKNPLTTIQGFIQLLQKENDKPFYFELILSEIDRLKSIVDELLILAESPVAQRREVSPESLLEQVLTIMNTKALLRGIEIKQEHDLNLPLIECDENQMKTVFINILQNAVDAMPNGGTITVQISSPDAHSIKFRFVDQGCGITNERMKHLGEPFYSYKEKGTGLGLMISHKIVQEHGGSIHIDSTVNQGTTVDVILPITIGEN